MEAFLHDNPDAKLGFYTRGLVDLELDLCVVDLKGLVSLWDLLILPMIPWIGLADLGDKFWEDVLAVLYDKVDVTQQHIYPLFQISV